MRANLFVTIALALAACGPVETPDSASPATGPVAVNPQTGEAEVGTMRPIVVMLGDSLTAGYGLSVGEALPAMVESRLADRGIAATLVNAGVSGDTTRGGLERYDWSVAGNGADMLVVALGANDFLNGVDADTARTNLAAIIQRARSDGLGIALLGVKPRGGAASDSREADYAAIYSTLAAEHGLPLLPDMLAGVANQPDLLQEDGLHPTAAGVDVIADRLADFFAPHITAWQKEHTAQ